MKQKRNSGVYPIGYLLRGTSAYKVAKLVVSAMLVSSTIALGADPAIRIEPGGSEVDSKFVVRDLPESVLQNSARWTDEQWQKLFAVHTVVNDRLAPTAILGEYSFANGKLTFTPRYPIRRGVTYRAVLRLPDELAKGMQVSRDFTVAELNGPATSLTAIYPTSDIVPENLLKFYLHFSAPMSRGEVYQRVRLLDHQGRQVESPFLELAEELWSPDGMRLTLYFDPGRIKRGLKPRELFGPALVEGQSYRLEIDANWPDAKDRPLSGKRTITKSFRVTAPDDQQPDVKRWKLVEPRAGARGPLTVVFDEPLDSAMLARVLAVRDPKSKPVLGDIEIGKGETHWSFRPASDWLPGEYTLVAATALEDLAGNSLGRPFEVDVFRPATNQTDTETVLIPFVPVP